jgi:hypothetical protein
MSGQLGALAKSMNVGTPSREVINNPVTLESTVNGALVTVQRNSIAHAELAQGENGMLVKTHNPNGRSRMFNAGVGFNADGTIKGREHLIQQRTPAKDVQNISPAQAAVRARGGDNSETTVVEDPALAAAEVELAEANDKVEKARLQEAEAKQAAAAAEQENVELKRQLREIKAAQGTATQVKKR